MGELIVLKDWIAKKEEEELEELEKELSSIITDLDMTVDYVIFDYEGNPIVVDTQSIVNIKI